MSHSKPFRKMFPAGLSLLCTCALCLQTASQPKSLVEAEPELATLLDKLEPIKVEAVPDSGTFWLLSRAEPPWPVLPPVATEFGLPIYLVDKSTFIVDDRSVDYAALAELDSALKAVELELGLRTESDDGLPVPGDGEVGPCGGGPGPTGWNYPSNVLWLELVTVTNQTGWFVIHTPEPNAMYDVFGTTNLGSAVAGLNLTNWAWLGRTEPGQTNFPVTGLWSEAWYFRLGTMLDSDGDGLTDAYERLVSKTDPYFPDTDGDGIPNWADAQPYNPNVGVLRVTIDWPTNGEQVL